MHRNRRLWQVDDERDGRFFDPQLHEGQGLPDDVQQVGGPQLRPGWFRQLQKLLDDAGRIQGAVQDRLAVVAKLWVPRRVGLIQHHLGVSDDRQQLVVDLVGDAAGQRLDERGLLLPDQSAFEFLVLAQDLREALVHRFEFETLRLDQAELPVHHPGLCQHERPRLNQADQCAVVIDHHDVVVELRASTGEHTFEHLEQRRVRMKGEVGRRPVLVCLGPAGQRKPVTAAQDVEDVAAGAHADDAPVTQHGHVPAARPPEHTMDGLEGVMGLDRHPMVYESPQPGFARGGVVTVIHDRHCRRTP